MQACHLVPRQVCAGRIVGVGDEDNPGPGRDRRQHGVDIDLQAGVSILFRHHHRYRAVGQGGDAIDKKSVLAEHRLVAGTQVCIGQHGQQHVRAVARTDDAVRVQAVHLADGFAQDSGRAFRIDVQAGLGLLHCRRDRRAGPQRGFVGRQLEHPLHARHMGAPAHIGGDVHDARSGGGAHRQGFGV